MISFTGLFFAIIFMLFFWYVFKWAYLFGLRDGESFTHDNLSRKIFIIFAFLGGVLCYYLVSQNRFIYYWDFGGYWTQSFSQMQILFSRPLLAVLRLGGSIFFSDYNSILPTLIAFPLKLFGYTFTRYVLVNYALFLVPAIFILLTVIKTQTGRKYRFLLIFAAFMFVPFYLSMLLGYIDIACLIPASIALLLLKDYDALSFTREQIKRDIYISGILLCTLLFRRYFVFYVEGFMTALVCLSIYDVMKSKKYSLLKNAVLNIIIIGLFALFIMIVFFAPMLYKIMKTNYTAAYTVWDAPLAQKILEVVNVYGYSTLIFAALGVILPLITGRMRRYSLFCVIAFFAAAGTFFSVQAMGTHHILILAPQLFILSCIGMISLCEILRKKFIPVLLILILSAGFANAYFQAVRPTLAPFAKFFSQVHNPLIRHDIPELNALCDYLNSMTDGQNKSVCIVSGGTLNFSLMDSLRKPYEQSPVHNLYRFMGADLRDGFPIGVLNANILVITDPIHGDQETITFPSRQLMSADSVIGRHFVKNDRVFTLENNVKVLIYEKQSDFTQEDLQYMADYFTKIYPGYIHMFADRILGRADISDSLSDKWSPKVVTVLRWLLKNNYFTAEELAFATNRTIHEINSLREE